MAKSAAAALHTEPKEPNFLQKFGHDFVHGDIFTKLSFFVWGLGYIGHGQLMKALLVTFVQGFALYFLAFFGVPNLAKFGTLGTVKMEMVFDVATMKNVVNDYDNSFEILLMSMIAFIVIAALIAAAMMVVSSNYQLQKIREDQQLCAGHQRLPERKVLCDPAHPAGSGRCGVHHCAAVHPDRRCVHQL